MRFVRGYLFPRLTQYLLVAWLGISLIFAIPRLLPSDPVDRMLDTMLSQGAYMEPEAVEQMTNTLREMYGLEEGLL